MRDTYTNSIIKVHYIWFYNVYKLNILIVKSLGVSLEKNKAGNIDGRIVGTYIS